MYMDVKSFIFGSKVKPPKCIEKSITFFEEGKKWIFDNRLHKFKDDEVFNQFEDNIVFFNGQIDNKDELLDFFGNYSYEEVITKAIIKNDLSVDIRCRYCLGRNN